MRTAASILALVLFVVLEVLKGTAVGEAVSPTIVLVIGGVGCLAAAWGLWIVGPTPLWRIFVALAGAVSTIAMFMTTYRTAAWMLRDAFPLASTGIVAAPIVMAWFGLLAWIVFGSSKRISQPGSSASPD